MSSSTPNSSNQRGKRRTRTDRTTLANPLHVAISRDPCAPIQVMGVQGLVNSTTIGALAIAFASIEDHCALHVDLTSANVESSEVLRALESLVDVLERRGVRLRVVGFDPHHPAI
jgi:hypothetical protein